MATCVTEEGEGSVNVAAELSAMFPNLEWEVSSVHPWANISITSVIWRPKLSVYLFFSSYRVYCVIMVAVLQVQFTT